MTEGLQRLDGRTVRPNVRRERKLCIIPTAPDTTRHNVFKQGPRYRAHALPDERWIITDSDGGEVCNCPTDRVVGLLSALNGQDAREKLCAI